MKKDSKVEFLREKNLEKTIELIKEKGKFTILSEYSTFFDMRTYFKVNEDGDISQKSYNPIILLYLFSDDEKNLAEYLFKYSYPEEKQNIKKIDRASNLDIETLKRNLMKTLVNSHLDFSKTFAKELFLRDKKYFFETAYNFSLMGNPKDLKLFFVYALEEIFSKINYDENIFYIIIAYLTKFRDDYSIYMEVDENNLNFDMKNYSDDKKIYLNIFEKVLNKYKLNKKDIREVVHLIDTDGAFIPSENVQGKKQGEIEYTEEEIIAKNPLDIKQRNKRKTEIVKLLYKTDQIYINIPYKIYYFSRNREHALNNKKESISDEEKSILADEFSDKYENNIEKFYEFMCFSPEAVGDEYKTSWEFILDGTNSLKRYHNFNIYLQSLKRGDN